MTRRPKAGFTLIELIISIVILGIGLVGVVGCLTAALVSNQKASRTQLATAIAQDTIEDMRSRGFGVIDYTNYPASQTVSGLPQGSETVAITDAYGGDARLKKVSVEVSWGSTNASTSRVRLETIVSNRAHHSG